MNALVKKEIRLLLPNFIVGCALALANWFLPQRPSDLGQIWLLVPFVFCPLLVINMALNSFGAEVGSGLFSLLLAQPISRLRIWRTKILVLGSAVLFIGIMWYVPAFFRVSHLKQPENLWDSVELFAVVATFGLVVFSGALWTVLLLRQVAAAFWFTLLVPGVIGITVSGLWPEKYYAACGLALAVVLLVYSALGIWFARWLFLQAQDVAWTGGNIVWPEMRGTANILSGVAVKRFWRPRAALFWKELQLHQSQFIMAGALALFHLGVLAARKFGDFRKNSDMEFILEIFWGLWLVMPMLVGAAAVAEERKLGTLTGQLCLPVKRRTQFAIKAGVVLLLSVLFGIAVPFLLEGQRIFPGGQIIADGFNFDAVRWEPIRQVYLWICLGAINSMWPLLLFFGLAIGIGSISFYASTFTRNTLQALAPAVLGIVIFMTLFFIAAQPEWFFAYSFWRGSLIYLIGVPVFAVTLATLSFWNCQRLDLGWTVWCRNGFAFVSSLAFVIATTTAIYHRAWEKLTPFEPAHGVARFSQANPPKLSEHWNKLSVRLEDGRIWSDNYWLNYSPGNPLALLLGDIRLTTQNGRHFYDGSNWVNVMPAFGQETVGIKCDGSLWVSEKPARRERSNFYGWELSKPGDLVRFDGDTNWSSVGSFNASMLLVKTDGTLWRWGATNWTYKNKWPGFRSFMPRRLGTESNWAEVFPANYQLCLRKTDGSVWNTWVDPSKKEQTDILEPEFTIQRATFLENGKWRSTTAMWSGLDFHLGISDDGTFRIRADQQLNQQTHTYELAAVDIQLGKGTNWLAVAGRSANIVTLKDDGTLWLWNFYHDNRRAWNLGRDEREMLDVKPVRLGTHADWIAITSAENGIVSLAADGSLWFWPLNSGDSYMSDTGLVRLFQNNRFDSFEPLLDISRKPRLIANIFNSEE